MSDGVRGEVRLTGLDQVVKSLEQLPGGIAGKGGGIARASLRKASKILIARAKTNLQSSISAAGRTGITDSIGFTAKQIAAKVSRRALDGAKGEALYVTVRYVQHPASRGKFRKKPIRANDIAFILEAGAKNIDPLPWMRPAFLATAQPMITEIEAGMVRGVEMLWSKYYGTAPRA